MILSKNDKIPTGYYAGLNMGLVAKHCPEAIRQLTASGHYFLDHEMQTIVIESEVEHQFIQAKSSFKNVLCQK